MKDNPLFLIADLSKTETKPKGKGYIIICPRCREETNVLYHGVGLAEGCCPRCFRKSRKPLAA